MTIKPSVTLTFAVSILFWNTATAEPNKVLYELQERCGKQASDIFKKEIDANVTDTSQGKMIANYENHYNARLNKCFYLQTATIISRGKDHTMSKSLQLFDLHENREIATYFDFDGKRVMQCEVGNNSCHTEQEWRALVKSFMEE